VGSRQHGYFGGREGGSRLKAMLDGPTPYRGAVCRLGVERQGNRERVFMVQEGRRWAGCGFAVRCSVCPILEMTLEGYSDQARVIIDPDETRKNLVF